MLARRIWAGLAVVCMMAVPALALSQQSTSSGGAPKAQWRSGAGTKTVPAKAKKTAAPVASTSLDAIQAAKPAQPEQPTQPVQAVPDQSQEVLDLDFAMAASIAQLGPKDGYASALSDEGVLYDANGASPQGREAAVSRFGAFPADVKLVRTPERALAAGGSGSSWGTYAIKRGETVLSVGRYISVWRREVSGWKMISELAAGKAPTPPVPSASPQIGGVLPKRPVQLGRAAPTPVGVPLTVPIPPPVVPTAQTPPTP
jgi:Domain of unknown function (DUF4440)